MESRCLPTSAVSTTREDAESISPHSDPNADPHARHSDAHTRPLYRDGHSNTSETDPGRFQQQRAGHGKAVTKKSHLRHARTDVHDHGHRHSPPGHPERQSTRTAHLEDLELLAPPRKASTEHFPPVTRPGPLSFTQETPSHNATRAVRGRGDPRVARGARSGHGPFLPSRAGSRSVHCRTLPGARGSPGNDSLE